jgi:hypothetical protein
MSIPTEPIGSIPRPPALIDAVARNGGNSDDPAPELVATIKSLAGTRGDEDR